MWYLESWWVWRASNSLNQISSSLSSLVNRVPQPNNPVCKEDYTWFLLIPERWVSKWNQRIIQTTQSHPVMTVSNHDHSTPPPTFHFVPQMQPCVTLHGAASSSPGCEYVTIKLLYISSVLSWASCVCPSTLF